MTSYMVYPNYFEEEITYLKNFTQTLNDEHSFLHQAILDERTYLLEAQLEDPSVDVNVRNQNFESPLLATLRLRNKKISLELISKLVQHPNLDVNLPDYHGDTPLHEAAKNEMPCITEEILTFLLNNPSCKVNVKNYLGETPLHIAKTVTTVRKLVEKGADFNRRDNSDNVPLHKQVKNIEICDFLLQQDASINVRNVNGFTPLHEAVYYNKEESVILLLEHGADANIENDYNHRITPLQIAYRTRASETIKTLLWEKSKPKYLLFVASYDNTKLPDILKVWSTVAKNEEEIVDFLLDLLKLLKTSNDLKMVTCGRLVAEYFLTMIHLLSLANSQRIIKKFSEYLDKSRYFDRSFLNFVLKTHDYSKACSLQEIENVVHTLLARGETLDYSDLEVIFLQFGDCSLLRELIKFVVTSRKRKLKQVPFFLKAIWNVTNDLTYMMESKCLSNIDVLDFYSVHTLARYCTLPPLLFKNFHDTYKNIIRFEKPDLCTKNMENCLEVIEKNSGIPKLLELSRNAVRPVLCRRYKVYRAGDLYRVLQKIGLAPLLISVIMMENPLYYNIKVPEYLPYTRSEFLL